MLERTFLNSFPYNDFFIEQKVDETNVHGDIYFQMNCSLRSMLSNCAHIFAQKQHMLVLQYLSLKVQMWTALNQREKVDNRNKRLLYYFLFGLMRLYKSFTNDHVCIINYYGVADVVILRLSLSWKCNVIKKITYYKMCKVCSSVYQNNWSNEIYKNISSRNMLQKWLLFAEMNSAIQLSSSFPNKCSLCYKMSDFNVLEARCNM